ncbi:MULTISPECIES: DUF461 domain-containing protein [unclassified Streptomyces]|uniref:DUF461 domain-containing protein n=1 Tax=Streptomycetaceae TaxID=2062 RepID=UPI002E78A77F|nr:MULTISPECIES: DUF461 domain-containing protein [unclassified Streptomyces]MED7953120.1 DUF461 domain-containing protein [Streptomyces sp. BE303]MEE1829147.1 DUF461 domain-containing protein [Streptomyces sp. BE20]
MSRSLRRGSIAAIAALAIASLSSCAAGNTPETLEIKPDNAAATLGADIRLNNIVVVTGDESSGEHTGPANVTVNISNTGAEALELQSITVGSGATATFADDKGAPLSTIVVPPGGAVLLGGQGNPSAKVASASLSVGGYVNTAFAFKNHEKLETEASVSPNKGLYQGFGPTSAPGAVPPKKAATPTAPASGSPSAAHH